MQLYDLKMNSVSAKKPKTPRSNMFWAQTLSIGLHAQVIRIAPPCGVRGTLGTTELYREAKHQKYELHYKTP